MEKPKNKKSLNKKLKIKKLSNTNSKIYFLLKSLYHFNIPQVEVDKFMISTKILAY